MKDVYARFHIYSAMAWEGSNVASPTLWPTLLPVKFLVLTQRLTKQIEVQIPEVQLGFRKGRIIYAVSALLDNIHKALRYQKGKFYAVFVDYTKAFNLLNRTILMKKLEYMIGNKNPLTISKKQPYSVQ